ncbi:transporter [Ganoderma sinense ZZ0214-1]|uniref:Acyl carrier protein n=1 Tax=Ganoderma sinense ZZ0214-1 TaxID=1077348 RepID=A0A2G8SCT6_9APHY|nr:transporter [Ganoderma sinense ZZ0214-1]
MFRLVARNFAARNLNVAVRSAVAPRPAFAARSRIVPCAAYSAAAGLSKEDITTRVLDVLKSFEKVDGSKLSTSAAFAEDLGLDSLDAVEVVMAVEEEFAIEIPDKEADEIKTVQQAIDYIAKTPEGPLYDPRTSILHFIDIEQNQVHHYNVLSGELTSEQFDVSVTCLALRRNGKGLACATSHGFALIEEGSSLKHLNQPIPTGFQPYTRFNDGACDRYGRFIAGTLFNSERSVPGQLYIYDPKLDVCEVLEPGPFTDSNGLGWTDGGKTMLFTDSFKNKIYAFDYEDGKVSRKRDFVDCLSQGLPEGTFPDGLCIDKDGGVWSARWGASRIIRYTKDGEMDLEVFFPTALNVTACTFGGPKNDQLYVTTAHCGACGGDASRQAAFPDSGNVFVVDLSGEFTGGEWRFEFGG